MSEKKVNLNMPIAYFGIPSILSIFDILGILGILGIP